MLINNQNPIDLNDKGDINNPQIQKDNEILILYFNEKKNN